MPGNSFGKMFTITTFGESHGAALGVVIDGIPAGLPVSVEALKEELKRRAPGQHEAHTSRKEDDVPEILSGVFEQRTLGTPITVIVRNTNQRSEDYAPLKENYRPGHADRTTMLKYGFRDHRGGGRASGRETLARVIGGYFAGLIIPQVKAYAYVAQVGPHRLQSTPTHETPRGALNIPDSDLEARVSEFLKECKRQGESAGGIVKLSLLEVPGGLGEPVFDKLKSDLAKAFVSLPACLGVAFGDGFDFAHKLGSEVSQSAASFGGIEGGISNGEEITVQLVFKAPSTIGDKARQGRHDPCVLPRVVPVVEAMAKIVIADHFLRQTAYASFLPSKTDP